MARVFWDGFDLYSALAQIAVKWQVYQGGTLAPGRFGARCLRQSGNTPHRIARSIPATDRYTVGKAIRIDGFNRTPHTGAGFYNSSALSGDAPTNRQIGWCLDNEGRVIVYRGANTILWQSLPGVVPNAAWTYVGFSAIIHPTNGAFAVSVKGQTIQQQTGINTQGLGDTQITNVNAGFSGTTGGVLTLDIDDVYMDDEYLANPPERRVETLRPTSDVSSSGFTPSTGSTIFGVLDEAQLDVADWASAALPGDFAEMELTNLENVPTVIDGVQGTGFGLKTDAATRAVKYGIRSNGVSALGPDWYLGSSVEQGFNNVLLNPDGNVPWTAAAVNAMRARLQISV